MATTDFRASARRLAHWCTGLIAMLSAVLVLEIATRTNDRRIGLDLLSAIPAALDLAALWSVRQTLVAVAGGALFTPALSRLLRQVGLLLLLAAATTVLLAPLLHRLAAADFPRLIEYDVANLVLGAVGAALMFLARLFEHAVDLQRELDEIF
ncbi:MAG: DUF2975 domain-containing protein [Sphingomicrobium sp.]